MPRLPTILVIGSHAISTNPLASLVGVLVAMSLPPLALVAGQQLVARRSPFGFLVDRVSRDLAQAANHLAVRHARYRRHAGAWRLVHERHELVREAGHRAADADPAHVGATPDAVDPTPLGHVALDHGAPAPQLDDAFGRAVLRCEVALLVVAGPVTSFVHGGAEEPLRPQRLVERDHGRLPGGLIEQIEDGFRQVVRLDRAAGDTHDRDAGLRLP